MDIGCHIPKGITYSNQFLLTKVTNLEQGLGQILLRQKFKKINSFLKSNPVYEGLIYKNQISCYYFGLTDYLLPKYVPNYEIVISQLAIKLLRSPYE